MRAILPVLPLLMLAACATTETAPMLAPADIDRCGLAGLANENSQAADAKYSPESANNGETIFLPDTQQVGNLAPQIRG